MVRMSAVIFTLSSSFLSFVFDPDLRLKILKSCCRAAVCEVASLQKYLQPIRGFKNNVLHCVEKDFGVRVILWYKKPEVPKYYDCLDFDIEADYARTQLELMRKRVKETVEFWTQKEM